MAARSIKIGETGERNSGNARESSTQTGHTLSRDVTARLYLLSSISLKEPMIGIVQVRNELKRIYHSSTRTEIFTFSNLIRLYTRFYMYVCVCMCVRVTHLI